MKAAGRHLLGAESAAVPPSIYIEERSNFTKKKWKRNKKY